ncbi:MIP/aquaporin family protein [Thermus scotoductus]|uniref:Glycerol transporter n=1 Tax=Thermus scotoductus TaxID=37636 RepID=A0A430R140_THESC|nr:MIP/aquaporin family protein [Thermus scotoductus]RTG92587.1 glycerol transporter [Thermus scotoductus]RTH01084.1 glycerol transporter [Thermus scotoductus]RTH17076.1 glycerol transporter [Thermus scotoductus]RTI00718.1 glycerol transporter [Thermus scotoductus]RTI18393.1 glycerol transporter [Thermus scotoductus]
MRIVGRAFVGEVLGTLLLVLLTVGSAVNAVLQPRLSPGAYGYDSLALGSGLAVLVGMLTSRSLSGAHLNPAVTLALAAGRLFPWRLVPLYLVAQFLGGFLGALGAFVAYREGLLAQGMPNVFSTGPGFLRTEPEALYAWTGPAVAETLGTFALMSVILAAGKDGRMVALWLALTVAAVGYGLGGPGGFALNPARDLAPRFLAWILGVEGAASPYLLVPALFPILGALGAVAVYRALDS